MSREEYERRAAASLDEWSRRSRRDLWIDIEPVTLEQQLNAVPGSVRLQREDTFGGTMILWTPISSLLQRDAEKPLATNGVAENLRAQEAVVPKASQRRGFRHTNGDAAIAFHNQQLRKRGRR